MLVEADSRIRGVRAVSADTDVEAPITDDIRPAHWVHDVRLRMTHDTTVRSQQRSDLRIVRK